MVDRSGTDDPDADRGLLLWHSIGAAAVRRGASEPRLSVVSLGGHQVSTHLSGPQSIEGCPEGFMLLCVLGVRRRRRTGWVEKGWTAKLCRALNQEVDPMQPTMRSRPALAPSRTPVTAEEADVDSPQPLSKLP